MFVYKPRHKQARRKPRSNSQNKAAIQQKPATPSPLSPQTVPSRSPPAVPCDLRYHPQPPPYQSFESCQHAPPPQPYYAPNNTISAPFSPSAVALGTAQKLRAKKSSGKDLVKATKKASVANLNNTVVGPLKETAADAEQQWKQKSRFALGQCDAIQAKFNDVMTLIDTERFSGREEELHIVQRQDSEAVIRGGGDVARVPVREASRALDTAVATTVKSPKSTNVFAKVNLYSNSRLPPWITPLKLYLPTYPLICLAAQSSERVYDKPTGKEKETHVDADWRHGTKAMVIKSLPVDDMSAIVIAIRGSQTFMDWTVNLDSEPTSPQNFLDDYGNMCHSGFLSTARKMVKPIAARLRSLLEDDPSRSSCSLILTGHSAGGAVASLIYMHMLAAHQPSELNILSGCFKRIHCITFGAPPVSLLPLTKPREPRYQKSLFLSFINQGDPVPRADKPYVRSLLDLYASPAPKIPRITAPFPGGIDPSAKKGKLGPLVNILKSGRPKPSHTQSLPTNMPSTAIWSVPSCTLSNAGKCIVMRPRPRVPGSEESPPGGNGNGGGQGEEDVVAQVVTDAEMRGVIWGDPVMHMMRVYRRRVEVLATKAVVGDGGAWA